MSPTDNPMIENICYDDRPVAVQRDAIRQSELVEPITLTIATCDQSALCCPRSPADNPIIPRIRNDDTPIVEHVVQCDATRISELVETFTYTVATRDHDALSGPRSPTYNPMIELIRDDDRPVMI
jgi:hypothetical protein